MSSLNFTSGTLTIDAGAGEITHSDGSFLLGEFTDKTFTAGDGTTYDYQLVTSTADTIKIGSGVVVNVTGDNPISLRTRNNGSLTIGTTIDVSGGAGTESPNTGGIGIAGGFNGGNVDVDGQGPGRDAEKSVVSGSNEQGGGAAYGGRGYDNDSAYSLTYGDADIADHLLGGSGGGGGDLYPGGAGGGAWNSLPMEMEFSPLVGPSKRTVEIPPASMPRVAEVVQEEVFVWKVVQCRFPVAWRLKEVMGYPPLLVGVVVLPLNQMVIWHWVPSHWMDTGSLHISGTTPTNAINFSSGTITFDTTHAYWHHTSGVHGTGVIEEKDDDGLTYKTCTFTFDSISLNSGLTVKLQG